MTPTATAEKSKSIDLDQLVRMHSEETCPTDNYDRYLIVPEGTKQQRPWTRTTTVAKACDDGFGVSSWQRRMSLLGIARSNVLYTRLCALDEGDKKGFDRLADEAKTLAGGDDSRELGTALHAFTERVDRGKAGFVPAPYDKDIEAYEALKAEAGIGIAPELVERYVCLPGLDGETVAGVAGKADRFVEHGNRLRVADVKTGKIGDYSWMAFAAQLAIYSRAASFYDPKTKKHSPVPEIDQDRGLIIHLPSGQARAALWIVDLQAGWEIAQLCLAVRAWRRRKDLAVELRPDRPINDPVIRRQRLIERLHELAKIDGGKAALVSVWPEGVPTFKQAEQHTDAQLDLIAMAFSLAEKAVQAPFGPLDPVDSPSAAHRAE